MKDRIATTTITPREFVLASLGVHALFFVLRFTYVWLDDVVREVGNTFLPRLLEEGTGALGSALLSWFVYLTWRAAPLNGDRLLRRMPAYAALGVALSVANTSFMWATRSVLFPVFGLGAYDYGRMPLRYLMELPVSLIGFVTMLTMIALTDESRGRRARHLRQIELERALAESQLQSLRLQLQPHFLFNALNTISSQLHENPMVADRLIGRLADLLRGSLRSTAIATVPLREELLLLEDYTELMRARFGTRLDLTVSCDPHVSDVQVPPVLLQPLVENAIRHGGLDRSGTARIQVRLWREEDDLQIQVYDDGPGVQAARDPMTSGTGLSATARRLALLHGNAARVQAGNAPDGGFVATISLPAA